MEYLSPPQAATFFRFEADFVDTLRCVPMVVRFKLDAVGIKLSLRAWSRFDLATRGRLATLPVDAGQDIARYRAFLTEAIEAVGERVVPIDVETRPAWAGTAALPEVVASQIETLALRLDGRQTWQGLTTLQRFVLVKLTRAGHDNVNFLPALREFGMVARPAF